MEEFQRHLYEQSVLAGVLGTLVVLLIGAVALLYRQLLKSYSEDRQRQRESNKNVADALKEVSAALKSASEGIALMVRGGDDRTRAQERTGEGVSDLNSAIESFKVGIMGKLEGIERELTRPGGRQHSTRI